MTQIIDLASTVAEISLCRRLVELGAPTGTRLHHRTETRDKFPTYTRITDFHSGDGFDKISGYHAEHIPAYSTDELLRLLPEGYGIGVEPGCSPRQYSVGGEHDVYDPYTKPADALAFALAELVDAGVVTFDTINGG